MKKATDLAILGASMGDFEQWIIDEQRKEKKKKKKPKRKSPQPREK